MPVYELLCLCRPLLQRDELQRMIQKVGGMVYTKGGVVTNVVSYGKQPLAYKVRGVQGKFDEVSCLAFRSSCLCRHRGLFQDPHCCALFLCIA